MIVIMRDAVMPDCCNTCVCSEGYGCGITGTEMTTKEMEERPDWCPLEEQEPCEDAVSREALRKAMYHRAFETDGDTMWQSGCWIRYRAVEQVIKESPSVTPKQEYGEWEEKAVSDEKVIDEWQSARCSACGKYHTASYMYYFNNYNYCPNCGADMRGEQE